MRNFLGGLQPPHGGESTLREFSEGSGREAIRERFAQERRHRGNPHRGRGPQQQLSRGADGDALALLPLGRGNPRARWRLTLGTVLLVYHRKRGHPRASCVRRTPVNAPGFTARPAIVLATAGNEHHVDPDTGDTALNVLTDILGPVEVIAVARPEARCLSPARVPAAARAQPCTARPGSPLCDGAEMMSFATRRGRPAPVSRTGYPGGSPTRNLPANRRSLRDPAHRRSYRGAGRIRDLHWRLRIPGLPQADPGSRHPPEANGRAAESHRQAIRRSRAPGQGTTQGPGVKDIHRGRFRGRTRE